LSPAFLWESSPLIKPSFPRNIGLSVAVVDEFLLIEPHRRLKLINKGERYRSYSSNISLQ
jgi:hypothetical protein